jgi:hypothetical protein
MKKKELVEIKVKVFRHQADYIAEAASKRGKSLAKRRNYKGWYTQSTMLRSMLDEYIFLFKPARGDIVRKKKRVA